MFEPDELTNFRKHPKLKKKMNTIFPEAIPGPSRKKVIFSKNQIPKFPEHWQSRDPTHLRKERSAQLSGGQERRIATSFTPLFQIRLVRLG